jgi:hypothetical protein
MKYSVKRLKNLKIALQELEPHIRNGRSLQVQRDFKSIGLRPRELLANWLLCATFCFLRGDEGLAMSGDPLSGDGAIFNIETGNAMLIEQVYIPSATDGDFDSLALQAFEKKAKLGKPYAENRTLVIFSEVTGSWQPNRLAREIQNTHEFDAVWVVHLDQNAVVEGQYAYFVVALDTSMGNAPVYRVSIGEDFRSWSVDTVQ